MGTLQEGMSGVLDKERVKNNLALTPFKRHEFTDEIRLAKMAHVNRRVKEGITKKKAIKETGVSEPSYYTWLRRMGAVTLGRKGGLRGGPAKTKAMTKKQLSDHGRLMAKARWKKKSVTVKGRERKVPTEMERMEVVKKAIPLLKGGLTQKQVGRKFGVHGATLSRWLTSSKKRVIRKPGYKRVQKRKKIAITRDNGKVKTFTATEVLEMAQSWMPATDYAFFERKIMRELLGWE